MSEIIQPMLDELHYFHEDHLSCPSYPNCDEGPQGCRVFTLDVELYGQKD